MPGREVAEQERIAAVLGKADRLRRLRRYALELGDSYLQSVFVEMFGDPVKNEKEWEEKTWPEILARKAAVRANAVEATPVSVDSGFAGSIAGTGSEGRGSAAC